MSENVDAAYEGLRHLARTAEDERVRFRACEHLLNVPTFIYRDGMVDPADLPATAVPVEGSIESVAHFRGAEL